MSLPNMPVPPINYQAFKTSEKKCKMKFWITNWFINMLSMWCPIETMLPLLTGLSRKARQWSHNNSTDKRLSYHIKASNDLCLPHHHFHRSTMRRRSCCCYCCRYISLCGKCTHSGINLKQCERGSFVQHNSVTWVACGIWWLTGQLLQAFVFASFKVLLITTRHLTSLSRRKHFKAYSVIVITHPAKCTPESLCILHEVAPLKVLPHFSKWLDSIMYTQFQCYLVILSCLCPWGVFYPSFLSWVHHLWHTKSFS